MTGDRPQDAALDAEPDLAGTLLSEKYLLLRRIGQGGMGSVYHAENVAIGRQVAIKVLRAQFAQLGEAVGRFQREARAAARIGHPNIIEVLDMGRTADGLPYIVMEHLEGEDVFQLLQRNGALRPAAVVDILTQVLEALSAAHAAGIVHRDLKPENVFLTKRGLRTDLVKVLDFGVALFHERPGAEKKRWTEHGGVVGTPAYMSPEQVVGQPLDARSDIWSAGVMAYELLAGGAPFTGETNNAIMVQIASHDPRPLSEVAPAVPASLAEVVHRALQREPAARYQTAREFSAALSPFVIAEELVIGSPAQAVLPPPRPPDAPRVGNTAETLDDPAKTPLRSPATGRNKFVALGLAVGAALVTALVVAPDRDAAPGARATDAAELPGEREAPPSKAPAPLPSVSIDVRSNVEGADVTLDGASIGTTPLHRTVAGRPGSHVLRVAAQGHTPAERTVDLTGPVDLLVELAPQASEAALAPGTANAPEKRPRPRPRRPILDNAYR